MSDVQTLTVQIPHELVQYWGWFLILGIGLAVLGVAAIARSVTATVVSMLFFGWLLAAASGIEIIQAIMVGHWAGFFGHLLAAILFGVTALVRSNEAVNQRRGCDPRHGNVLSDRRAV